MNGQPSQNDDHPIIPFYDHAPHQPEHSQLITSPLQDDEVELRTQQQEPIQKKPQTLSFATRFINFVLGCTRQDTQPNPSDRPMNRKPRDNGESIRPATASEITATTHGISMEDSNSPTDHHTIHGTLDSFNNHVNELQHMRKHHDTEWDQNQATTNQHSSQDVVHPFDVPCANNLQHLSAQNNEFSQQPFNGPNTVNPDVFKFGHSGEQHSVSDHYLKDPGQSATQKEVSGQLPSQNTLFYPPSNNTQNGHSDHYQHSSSTTMYDSNQLWAKAHNLPPLGDADEKLPSTPPNLSVSAQQPSPVVNLMLDTTHVPIATHLNGQSHINNTDTRIVPLKIPNSPRVDHDQLDEKSNLITQPSIERKASHPLLAKARKGGVNEPKYNSPSTSSNNAPTPSTSGNGNNTAQINPSTNKTAAQNEKDRITNQIPASTTNHPSELHHHYTYDQTDPTQNRAQQHIDGYPAPRDFANNSQLSDQFDEPYRNQLNTQSPQQQLHKNHADLQHNADLAAQSQPHQSQSQSLPTDAIPQQAKVQFNEHPNYAFYMNHIKANKGESPNLSGMHSDWWDNFSELEACHGFIQWLFPLKEHGMNHLQTPLVPGEIELMKNSLIVQHNMVKSFYMMANFWGFEVLDTVPQQEQRQLPTLSFGQDKKVLLLFPNELERSRSPSNNSSTPRFATTHDNKTVFFSHRHVTVLPKSDLNFTANRFSNWICSHNDLRVTRCLKSLCLMGLENYAFAFYTALFHICTHFLFYHPSITNAKQFYTQQHEAALEPPQHFDQLHANAHHRLHHPPLTFHRQPPSNHLVELSREEVYTMQCHLTENFNKAFRFIRDQQATFHQFWTPVFAEFEQFTHHIKSVHFFFKELARLQRNTGNLPLYQQYRTNIFDHLITPHQSHFVEYVWTPYPIDWSTVERLTGEPQLDPAEAARERVFIGGDDYYRDPNMPVAHARVIEQNFESGPKPLKPSPGSILTPPPQQDQIESWSNIGAKSNQKQQQQQQPQTQIPSSRTDQLSNQQAQSSPNDICAYPAAVVEGAHQASTLQQAKPDSTQQRQKQPSPARNTQKQLSPPQTAQKKQTTVQDAKKTQSPTQSTPDLTTFPTSVAHGAPPKSIQSQYRSQKQLSPVEKQKFPAPHDLTPKHETQPQVSLNNDITTPHESASVAPPVPPASAPHSQPPAISLPKTIVRGVVTPPTDEDPIPALEPAHSSANLINPVNPAEHSSDHIRANDPETCNLITNNANQNNASRMTTAYQPISSHIDASLPSSNIDTSIPSPRDNALLPSSGDSKIIASHNEPISLGSQTQFQQISPLNTPLDSDTLQNDSSNDNLFDQSPGGTKTARPRDARNRPIYGINKSKGKRR